MVNVHFNLIGQVGDVELCGQIVRGLCLQLLKKNYFWWHLAKYCI